VIGQHSTMQDGCLMHRKIGGKRSQYYERVILVPNHHRYTTGLLEIFSVPQHLGGAVD